jgi:hypothetical protein
MKAQVLFDNAGKIIGMLHLLSEENSRKGPVATLSPQAGQNLATLNIPAELHHLKPIELHASLRVDLSGGSPRLVHRK